MKEKKFQVGDKVMCKRDIYPGNFGDIYINGLDEGEILIIDRIQKRSSEWLYCFKDKYVGAFEEDLEKIY